MKIFSEMIAMKKFEIPSLVFALAGSLALTTSAGAMGQEKILLPLDVVGLGASAVGAPVSDGKGNLYVVANGSCVIEVGNNVISVEATMAAGPERDRLYAQHAAIMPQFNDYAKNTTRTIPVVVLEVKG